MQFICLALGSVLAVLFIVMMFKNASYDSYVANLNNDEYPLYALYSVGFGWSKSGPLAFSGNIRSKLINQAKLLYEQQYAEYYAALCWAQVLTMVHLFLTLGFLLAGALNFAFFAVVGIAVAALFGYYFLNKMKSELAKREEECSTELPEVVSSMALLINSGMVLREAWELIAYSKEGTIYELMRNACVQMQNGVSTVDAIYEFGVLSSSPEIRKFSGALIQGMEKGSKDLANFLVSQSSEMWEGKKQRMLQKGEAAATKLLFPILLIFGGILVIVISAAVGMMF